MVTLDDFCAYARIDVQDDAETINHLIASAEIMVQDQTGKTRPDGNADSLFDIAVMMLAAHWYDNRTPVNTSGGAPVEIPYTLTLLLNHIAISNTFPEAVEQ